MIMGWTFLYLEIVPKLKVLGGDNAVLQEVGRQYHFLIVKLYNI